MLECRLNKTTHHIQFLLHYSKQTPPPPPPPPINAGTHAILDAPEAISIETEAEQAKKTGKGKKGKPTAAALTRGSLFVSFFNLKALNLDLYP